MNVGDKVLVTPLHGDSNNLVVLQGGNVITEGDYNTWTHKWTNSFSGGLYNKAYQDHYIDDKNDVVYFAWRDSAGKRRLALYNLSDFSTVFLSPSGVDYIDTAYAASESFHFGAGIANFTISHAIQTYALLNRYDAITLEVWKGGAAYLWTHDIQTEVPGDYVYSFSISPTGKYIIVVTYTSNEIILYEGSSV